METFVLQYPVAKPEITRIKPRKGAFPKSAMGNLVVRQVEGKGRGVFAQRAFQKHEVIEQVPVIVLAEDPWELLNQTTLGHYYYSWGNTACAFALGFGALYNHSERPNAAAIKHLDTDTIEFVALRPIDPGEEITHKYQCPVWFEVKD